jgi:thiol-disulfide isomerase/thioredoxin
MLARVFALTSLVLALFACSPRPPSDARTTVVSLVNADCADCGDQIAADLRQRPGVYTALFDRPRAEIKVVASPGFDVLHLVEALARAQGFEAELGAGHGRYVAGPAFPKGADVAVPVRGGEDVAELSTVAVGGKVTVVDLSATWCKPCRAIDEHMVKVLGGAGGPGIAYRKLEIVDWDSPLAQHYLQAVPQLPYVVVFAKDKRRVGEVVGVDVPKLDALMQQAGAQP